MSQANVYHSPYPLPAIPHDQSVSQFLTLSNPDDAHPDTVILADFDDPEDRKVTYGGLRHTAAREAAILRHRHGLREAGVVCIYGFNSVAWASIAHATLWSGGCFCGVNPLATRFELVHYFRIARPIVVAVDVELLPNVIKATQELGSSPAIVVIDHSPSASHCYAVYPRDFKTDASLTLPPFDLSNRDNRTQPAAMCFSSGTSGLPKAVVMSHHNLIAQLLCLRSTNPPLHNARVREVFFPPFAHVYGLVSAVLVPAWVGSYLQPMRRFDYLHYLRRCADIRATVLRLVPAAAIRMVKDLDARRLDLRSVQSVMCSGAALSDETVEGMQQMLGLDAGGVLNGYGMTEATVTLLRETRRDKGASVGRPSAGVSIRIVDNDLNDVPPGTDGECLVRGPSVFLEYKDNPEATAEAKTSDGWLRTGDVVRADEEGYFYFVGRKKELIKFRGNQISPAELEAVLLLHESVAEAGVSGVYDSILDTEIAVGFVTLIESVSKDKQTRQASLLEIEAFVNERVAPYKKFRRPLIHLDALPKTSSGKVMRRQLTALATEMHNRKSKL